MLYPTAVFHWLRNYDAAVLVVDDKDIIHAPAGRRDEAPGLILVDSAGDGGAPCIDGVIYW